VNANEFINWFGGELQRLIDTTNITNRLSASRSLVADAINKLEELPQIERERVQDLLMTSYQSRVIGDFRIPHDIREEYDWIEGILATIEAYLKK
jgi:hypothetical protein